MYISTVLRGVLLLFALIVQSAAASIPCKKTSRKHNTILANNRINRINPLRYYDSYIQDLQTNLTTINML